MKLTLALKKQEAKDVLSYFFEPDEPLVWQAGQFLTYTLPHTNPDKRGIERHFTIASAPHEKHVMLTTRFATQQPSSFKTALYRLKVGDVIEAEGPEGDFTIENREDPQVFIAGGLGITPFRSILLDMEHRKLPMNIALFYANRSEDFVFKGELDEIRSRHPEIDIRYFVTPARINEEEIAKDATAVFGQTSVFYISGPEPMIDIFYKILGGMGVLGFRIKRDYFPGYIWT